MRKIRIDFCDIWDGFAKTDHWLWRILRERFDLELCDEPDFLIYCNPLKHVHRLHNCVKIWTAVESWLPDWSECDYALTYHYLDDQRHLRLPLYVTYADPMDLVKRDWDFGALLRQKRRFCAAVISNATAKRGRRRVEFLDRLNRRKPVDSGGRYANNIGGPISPGSPNKVAWLRDYRFNLCMENESLAGYTTEKIIEAMLAQCVPVYWGSPRIAEEFNPRSFLDLSAFENDEALIERMLEIDADPSAYESMLREPYFHGDTPNEFFDHARVLDFFERIFSTPIRPVSQRRKWFLPGRWVLAKQNKPHPIWT